MFEKSREFAIQQDKEDKLASFRKQFIFPQHNDADCIYFCGNSLGLQPVTAKASVGKVFNDWANLAVLGHHHGENQWMQYHKQFKALSADWFGAKEEEINIMNTLSVNLHLLMASFYRPTNKKYKIIAEKGMFPSDRYAFTSQIDFHARNIGFDVSSALVEIETDENDYVSTDRILEVIENNADSTALVLFGGINYYTGQFFNLEAISKKCQDLNIPCGFDLAHVAGNIPVKLNEWGVDFACWCTYKYMNSGPGGPSGIFVHEKHFNQDLPRLHGWWGNNESTRFLMKEDFDPEIGAEAWQMSNPSIFSMAPLQASLELARQAGADNLRKKSIQLTNYLEYLLLESEIISKNLTIVTPSSANERGAQLSLRLTNNGKEIFNALMENGVI